MKYYDEIKRFVEKPFINTVQISPLGDNILYVYSDPDLDKERYICKLGSYNILEEGHKKLLDESEDLRHVQWAQDGLSFSYIKEGKVFIYETTLHKLKLTIELDEDIIKYIWSSNGEGMWLVAEKVDQNKALNSIAIGDFNHPAHLYYYDFKSTKLTRLFTEETGSIVDLYAYKEKLFYSWKENEIYDFPGVLKSIDLNDIGNQKILTQSEMTIIQILSIKEENTLSFLGYDQYPSNSCMTKKIYNLNLDSGDVTLSFEAQYERGVSLEISAAKEFMLMKEFHGTHTAIYKNDGATTKTLAYTDKSISNVSLSQNGNVCFVMQDFNKPLDIYYGNLKSIEDLNAYKPINLFNSRQHTLDAKIVEWVSQDNKKIEGILVAPSHGETKSKKPLIVITTGRSNTFTRACLQTSDLLGGNDKFPYPVKIFSDMGYYTLLANCRGNVYHEYENLSHRSHMTMDGYCHNVLEGIHHVTNQCEDIDTDRIAVAGWSLGGYIAARISSWPENNIKTTVIGNAVTNLMSMYSCSNCFEFNAFMRGGFWTSKEYLEQYLEASPVNYISNITGSTLIQHGRLDPAMPVQQGREYYYALRLANKKVKMTEFTGAGHVFDNPKDLMIASQEVVNWLEENL